MSNAQDDGSRKTYLDWPLRGPKHKKLKLDLIEIGDRLFVDAREWVFGPKELDGPSDWRPTGGLTLTPEEFLKLMEAGKKVESLLRDVS